MARPKNTVESVQLTVSVTEVTRDLLGQLTRTGLYGKNPADAAARLVTERLHEILREGVLLKLAQTPTAETSPPPS